jgi:CheY-like chemotaxis protein
LPAKIEYCISGIIAEKKVKLIKESSTCKSKECTGYQLIFMDVEMPQQNGIETTQNILNYLKFEAGLDYFPYIVGCSGYDSKEIKEQCLNVGMQSFLVKPVDRVKLKELLTAIFI